MIALGIDTSNYATSVAVFDFARRAVVANERLLLAVSEGQLGLRQRDAVFAHTQNLPILLDRIKPVLKDIKIDSVGVSARPRDIEGSYMPCFAAGISAASAFAAALSVPLVQTSHQTGHIQAALYGCGLDAAEDRIFYAVHFSGGTTEILRCEILDQALCAEPVAATLDLYAGQLVDRVGLLLGCSFPAGPELSALAAQSDCDAYAKPVLKGSDCCVSGLENQCKEYYHKTGSRKDTARYCLLSVGATLERMLHSIKPGKEANIIFAGGVLSSSVIRAQLKDAFPNGRFCEPAALSSDNAVGVAISAALAKVEP